MYEVKGFSNSIYSGYCVHLTHYGYGFRNISNYSL